jgi:hypothetical protein
MRNKSPLLLRFAAAFAVAVIALPNFYAQNARQDSSTASKLVDRASLVVADFVGQISDVECTELVSQTRLEKSGKVEYVQDSSFDYVVLAASEGGELTLAESRLAKQSARETRNLPLMVTNGFSTLLLIFHPYYRAGFEFTSLEDGVVEGKSYARVGFRHIRGLRSTTALLVRGREYPLDLQGEAWIDRDTGRIWKMTAGLEAPLEDIGLRSLNAEVVYGPVKFQGTSNTYWLPQSAVIEVESPRQHWRNVHRFTAYHQFSTNVKEKVSGQP